MGSLSLHTAMVAILTIVVSVVWPSEFLLIWLYILLMNQFGAIFVILAEDLFFYLFFFTCFILCFFPHNSLKFSLWFLFSLVILNLV